METINANVFVAVIWVGHVCLVSPGKCRKGWPIQKKNRALPFYRCEDKRYLQFLGYLQFFRVDLGQHGMSTQDDWNPPIWERWHQWHCMVLLCMAVSRDVDQIGNINIWNTCSNLSSCLTLHHSFTRTVFRKVLLLLAIALRHDMNCKSFQHHPLRLPLRSSLNFTRSSEMDPERRDMRTKPGRFVQAWRYIGFAWRRLGKSIAHHKIR